MAYTKKTWATGDIAEAVDMNHIEDGIYDNDQAITAMGGAVGDQGEAITALQGDVFALGTVVGKLPEPAENDGTFVITQHNGNMELTEMDTALGDSEIIQNKADIDGTYPDMVAGNMLSNTGLTDMVPYNFRASAGGPREYDEIVGGTVAWNQLVANIASAGTMSCTTSYNSGTGELTITPTDYTSNSGIYVSGSLNPDHVMLQSIYAKADASVSVMMGSESSVKWVTVGTTYQRFDYLFGPQSNRSCVFYANVSAAGWTNEKFVVKNLHTFDLTAAFGTTIANYVLALEQATAGAGVAWLKAHGFMTKDYYAYNTGSLESVQTSAHVMTGKNLLPLTVADIKSMNESVAWNGNVGTRSGITITIQTDENDNVTEIKFNGTSNNYYYFNVTGDFQMDGKYILSGIPGTSWSTYFSRMYYTDGTETAILGNDATFTTAKKGRYQFVWTNGATLNNIIVRPMLRYASAPSGYEPRKTWSYPLDSSLTLRGIMKLQDGKPYFDGDRYASDGTVTRRYGLLDLGTLTWEYTSGTGQFYVSYSTISPAPKKVANTATVMNAICSLYPVVSRDNSANKTIAMAGNGNIVVYDSDYTDVAAFKSAMSGVYLVYELATPTTETAQPFTSPQTVDPYGTEAYTDAAYAAGDRDFELPVGHETFYPTDQVAKLDGLPSDLSMIAPIENGTTASQAYTTGQYFLKDNKFCKALTSIASGATFTLNTNYSVTTVAAELFSALSS